MDCGFTSIVIPSSVNSIGTYAFAGSSLTSITIPSTISTIGVNPFAGCNNLTSIIVSTSNSNYDSRNNCNAIIETATNTIVATCQTTSIPSTVTAIGTEAFSIRNDLTTMVIPSNITAIGNGAFSHCQNLVSISIPNTVTSIGAETFGYTPLCDLPPFEYNAEKDITKYGDTKAQTYVTVKPGQFAIFFPQDGHAPCITDDAEIKKAIFKVKK